MNLKTATKIILVVIAACIITFACGLRDSFCLPEVDSVEAGSISFDNSVVNTMTINASDKAIVNYKSFSIAENETVNVVLPDASSQILNRVVENNVSNIFGNLFCNGILFLVNPAGINVGPNANVQSAGLVFSTRDITNSNFLSSNYVFEKTSKEALDYLLLNQGNIKITNAGFGVFVAGAIENSGIITAELGTIAMAAGDLVTLSLAGNQFISIAVDKETASTVYDYQGRAVTDQIKNTGTIQAKNIILKAEALTGLFEKAINLEGFVRADTLDDSNGVVRITTKGAVYARLPEVTNIEVYKSAGDLNLTKSSLNDVDNLITLEGENINLTYMKTANLTLSAENAINTQEGVIIQANQVKLIAKQFGSLDVPLNINANNTYIQRVGGNIDILESIGLGSTVMLRGPPEGFGAIIYNKDTNLTLNAEKVQLVSENPTYLYGNITFYNFYCDTPGKEIYFEAGKTYSFEDNLYIGVEYPSYPVYLKSSQLGEYWNIKVESLNYILTGVVVQDSYNLNDTYIYATPAASLGHNHRWTLNTTYWSGAGGDNNWSTAANWFPAVVPISTESVVFNGDTTTYPNANKDSTINSGFNATNTIASLTINGYTGTISVAVNFTISGTYSQTSGAFSIPSNTLSVGNFSLSGGTYSGSSTTQSFNGTFAISGGTFNGSSGQIDIATTFDLSGGIFNAPSSLRVYGSWTVTGGTFNHNNGTVIFLGYDSKTINSGGQNFNNIWIPLPFYSVTLTNNLSTDGYLNIDTSFDTNNYSVTTGGLTTVSNPDGFGSGAYYARTAQQTFGNLTISTLGQFICSTGKVEVNGNLTMSAGTFTCSSGEVEVNGTLTISGGTLTGSTGIVDVNGDVNITTGTLTAPSGDFTVSGNWSKSGGTFTTGSNTVTFDGGLGVTQTLASGGTSFYNLAHSGAGTLQATTNQLGINNNFTNSAGTFDANDLGITVEGTTEISEGEYQAKTGTQNLNYLTVSGGTFTGSSGTVTAHFVNLSSGTLTAPDASGTFYVYRDWSVTGGAFNPNAGTVTFYGLNFTYPTQTLDSGGQSFNNIVINKFESLYYSEVILQLTNNLSVAGTLTITNGTFDANGKAVTVEGLTTISRQYTYGNYLAKTAKQTFNGGLTISNASGYAGTLTCSSGEVEVNGTLSIAGGTFTGSTGIVDVNGDVNITSGTLTAPSATMYVSGNWSLTSGAFTHNSGIVEFDKAADTQTLISGGAGFYNLIHSGAGTLQIVTNTLSAGNITNSAETFDANDLAVTVSGTLEVSGGEYLAKTGTQTFGYLTVSGGTFTGSTGLVYIYNNVSLTSGTLTAPSSSMYVSGNWSVTGGTFSHNSGTVSFVTGNYKTINGGGQSFNNITMVQPLYTITLTGDLNADGDVNIQTYFDANGYAVTIGGLTTVSNPDGFGYGNYYARSAKQTFGNLTISTLGQFICSTGKVEVNGTLTISGGTLTGSTGIVDVNGDVSITSGTLTAPSGDFTVSGNWYTDYWNGTFTPGTNTVTFDAGNGITQTIYKGNSSFYNIIHSGAGTLQIVTGALTVTNNFTNSSGIFDANGYYFAVSGTAEISAGEYLTKTTQQYFQNLTISGGTFTCSSGTVTVNNILTVSGGTFNGSSGNLTLGSGSPSQGLSLTSGTFKAPNSAATFTVSGSWSVTGGTFNHNNGTVKFTSTWPGGPAGAIFIIDSGGQSFYNLTSSLFASIAWGYDILKLENHALTVEGIYNQASGTFDANGQEVTIGGLATINGIYTYYYARSAKQTFNGGLTISSYSFICSTGNVEINGDLTVSGAFTGSTGTVDVNGSVYNNSGTFTAPSSTMYISGDLYDAVGSFSPNNGTVVFDGGGISQITASLYNLTITNNSTLITNNALAVSGAFNIIQGTFDANGQVVTVSGRTTVSGGEYLAKTATQNLNGGLTVSGGTFTGGSGDVYVIGAWGAENGLLLSSGTLTAPSGTLHIALSFDITGGTFHHNNGTVRFYGGGGTSDELQSNGQHFYNIISEKTGWGITLWQWDLYVDGALTVAGTGNFYTWDADVTVEGLTTVSGGSYLIETGAHTLNGGLTINGGNFTTATGATTYSLDLNGDLNLSSGLFQAPKGSFTMSGNWSRTGGTFSPGTGTVTFDKTTGTQTVDSGGTAFQNLAISGGAILQPVNNTLTTNNNLDITNGVLDMATNDLGLTVYGTFTIAANQNYYTATYNQSIATLNNSGNVICNNGGIYSIGITNMINNDGSLWTYTKNSEFILVLIGTYHDLTFNDGGGSATYLFNGTTYITGTLSVLGGTCQFSLGDDTLNVTENIVNNDEINITAGTLNLSGNLINNGTFTSSNSTVAFNGSTIISGFGTNSFDNITINGDLTAPNNANMNVAGNWTSSSSGSFFHNNGTVTFNGTTAITGTGNTNCFNNIIITGTLTAPSGIDMYVSGDWTNNGTFIANSGTIDFTYAYSSTISGTSENSFYGFKIGQTINAPSGNMNVAGNWTNFGYTFNHNNGTVTFNGTDDAIIYGSTTFYNFTCTTAGKTLKFVSGTTQTIEGAFTLTGASGNLITLLRSGGSGTNQWYIDPQGTRSVRYVDVQNSNNINTTIINARHSTDSGNNINWFFIPTAMTWTGAVSTNWDTAANWDNNFTPEAGDSAIITDVANDPILATAVSINNLTINSDAILDLNAKNLTLTGTFTNNGTLKLVGSETLTGFTNDATHGTVEYYGTGTYSSLAAGNTYYDLVISNSGTYSINNDLTVNGNLTISNASANFNLNGHNASFATTSVFSNEGKLRLQGSEVLTNFNNDTDSGTVEYYGVGPYTGLAAGNTYYNLMLSGGTITLTANLDINGTLSFGQGSGYAYYKSITIDHTKVDETLTDYPLLFSVTDSELAGTGSGGYVTNANGYDIIFKDASGNLLDFEIEHYDSSTGQYIAWVKVPTVSSSSDTVIYAYFGNSSITTSQENVAGVWSSGYQAVWHYDDATGSGTVADSTGNYDGTTQGNTTQGSTGLIGTAVTLNDGSNDYITVSSTAAIANSSASTLEMWVNASSQSVIYGFYSETAAAPNPNGVGYLFFKYDLYGGTMFATATNSGGVYLSSATSYPDSTWTQFVCVVDGTNLTFYKNGSLLGTTSGTASDSTINGINIGSFNGYFKGLIDEMRTSTVARSSGWISTQYTNQSDPGGFSTEGSKQANSSSVTLATAGFDVNIAGDISNTYNTGIVSGTGTAIFDGAGTSTVTGTTTLPNVEITLGKTVDLNGSNITFGGTFVNNGTLKLIGSETLTGFVNDTDSGIVEYTGNGVYPSLSAGDSYYDLTISGSGSFTAISDLTIYNDFIQSNGTFIAPSNMDISGNFTHNSGTFNSNSGTVTFNKSSGTQTLDSGGQSFNNITKSNDGSLQLTSNNLNITGTLTLTGGTFDANGLTTTIGGTTEVQTGSTYLASSNTQTFNGRLNISGGTFTGGTGTVDVNGNLNLSAGTLDAPSGDFKISRNFNITGGTFNHNNGTVNFDRAGSGTQTLNSGGQSFYDITKTKNGTLQLSADLTVDNKLSLWEGTFDANGKAVTVDGITRVHPGSTYLASTGTQTFNNNLNISGGTFTGGSGNVDLNGNLNLSAGTFNAPTGDFTISGNWSNTGGTFNSNSGTVTFTDATQSSTLSGDTTFNNLTCTTAGKSLVFTAGSTQEVDGLLTLTGTAGSLISLTSSSPGSVWYINDAGTEAVSFVDVEDSTATNSITANSSKDNGNNTNWIFSSTTLTWDGSTDTTWNTASNWDLGYVPNSSDNIVIANVVNSPLLTLAVTVNDLTINTNATLDLDTYDLTLTGAMSNDGILRLVGSQTLTGVVFDANSGTTEYYGLTTAVIMGDNTYYNLTCTTAGKELDFEAGKTTTIINELTLTGAVGNLIKIRSTTTGVQAKIDPQGLGLLRDVSYVDVKDSNNINGTTINPLTSTDSGNTVNWFPTSSDEPPHDPWKDDPVNTWDPTPVNPAPEPGVILGDIAMASGSDLVSYEEGNKFKKPYLSGKYKTTVIVMEGKVAVAPYDEKGIKQAEEKLLTSGQSTTEEGVIPEAQEGKQAGYGFDLIKLEQQTNKYAKSYIPAKYRTKVTAIEGEFDVAPYNEASGADYTQVVVVKDGESLLFENTIRE